MRNTTFCAILLLAHTIDVIGKVVRKFKYLHLPKTSPRGNPCTTLSTKHHVGATLGM